MKLITQIPFDEKIINFMVDKNFVGYSFEHNDNNYGLKTVLKTKKRDELVGAIATLAFNAVATYQSLKNGNNTDTKAS